LAETIAGLARRPATLVAASAIGYYGDRGDEPVTEDTPHGTGFLAELCRDWEAASEPAREAGVRVVRARIGLVLTSSGGSLQRVLPARALQAGFGFTFAALEPALRHLLRSGA